VNRPVERDAVRDFDEDAVGKERGIERCEPQLGSAREQRAYLVTALCERGREARGHDTLRQFRRVGSP
jgi:hypothetical protein